MSRMRIQALAGAFLAASLAAAPALGQSADFTGSITSVAPRTAIAGKLATRTEIVADRGLAAMVTAGSREAMKAAIAMYEEIVAGGGWPSLSGKNLKLGASGPDVLLLRQGAARPHTSLHDSASVW